MQGALIKKKLEEQRENYRRRHDPHHKQPTPISFTPTSVLRKMTADKEAEAPSPKQQPPQPWAQPPKMPQGRPIVKGNQSGAATAPFGQPEYAPHHYLGQQQMAGVRAFPQPAPRQQYAAGAGGRTSAPTTLQQLLLQSRQRSLNELGAGGAGAGAGGGDNQLARWFSPELLARASAGKLPSVHVPNAVALEDLERHQAQLAPHPAQPLIVRVWATIAASCRTEEVRPSEPVKIPSSEVDNNNNEPYDCIEAQIGAAASRHRVSCWSAADCQIGCERSKRRPERILLL
ncbi:hypothetical protein RR46_10403 [Papilio xuthus]|uniref:Uncharacterized protein n=1 Tax=Papilio xuthus TaxID=66420 RepID=A0A194Q6R7_PAPXU|nr:hypothetical protein RR46_10403 [Papilio xuthus]